MKITITHTTKEEVDLKFPIYRKATSSFMCAIYSLEDVYMAREEKGIEKADHSLNEKIGFYLDLFNLESTHDEWIELVKKAKEYQQKHFIDITWRESMEQNPAMADMTIKDYSPERLEEMNMGVREDDEAERMERHEENEY